MNRANGTIRSVRGGISCPRITPPLQGSVWYNSAHASLCVLGSYLRRIGFFTPLEEQVQIQQKTLRYTPVQKLEMFLVALLAGAKAVSPTDTTVGVDPALCAAFGLPGCADQSVIAATLNAATLTDVAALQAALAETFRRFSRARRHDVTGGAARAGCRSIASARQSTGRGVRAVLHGALSLQDWAQTRESAGRPIPGNGLLNRRAWSHRRKPDGLARSAHQKPWQLLGLAGEDEVAQAKRGQVEIRLDSGWGSEAMITWGLARGYQVTGKWKREQSSPQTGA